MKIQIDHEWRIVTDTLNVIAQKMKKPKDKNKVFDPNDDNSWSNKGYWPFCTNGGRDSGIRMALSYIVDYKIGDLDSHVYNEVDIICDAIKDIHDWLKKAVAIVLEQINKA